MPVALREALARGSYFVATGKSSCNLNNSHLLPPRKAEESRASSHPPPPAFAACHQAYTQASRNSGCRSSTVTRRRINMSITPSRRKKDPSLVFATNQEFAGMLQLPETARSAPRAAVRGGLCLSLPRISCSRRFSGSSPGAAGLLLPI